MKSFAAFSCIVLGLWGTYHAVLWLTVECVRAVVAVFL